MLIWAGLAADDLGDETPDLIVLPEDVSQDEIDQAQARCPDAIIVGAVREHVIMDGVISEKGFMQGGIWHRGRNQIDYFKVGDDTRSAPSPRPETPEIYVSNGLAVGVLICMDFDIPTVRNGVIAQLAEADAKFRVLCVPAGMASHWLSSEPISPPSLAGIHVVVSNNTFHGDGRLPSFITNLKRMKERKQCDRKPISLELDADEDRAA